MTWWRRALLALAVVISSPHATTQIAEAEECLPQVGRWPYGPAGAVAVSGGFAYIGSGAVLKIADTSDPSATRVLGEVALPNGIADIAVAGPHAFVVADGLWVLDVADPEQPHEVGWLAIDGSATQVEVGNGYVFVVDWYSGVMIVDVSDPSRPTEVGFFAPSVQDPGWMRIAHLAIANGLALVAASPQGTVPGVFIFDISTPSSPNQVSLYEDPFHLSVGAVGISGDYAFVSVHDGLRVLDISDPSHPAEIARIDDVDGPGNDMTVAGGFAFMAAGALRIFDVSEPAAPSYVGYGVTGGNAVKIAVAGARAFLAAGAAGVAIMDVSDPSATAGVPLIGGIPTPGYADLVAATDGLAFVVDELGLRVFDVTTPSNPRQIGFSDVELDHPNVISAANNHVFIGDDSGLTIVEVSLPSQPNVVASMVTGHVAGLDIEGQYAYFTYWDQGSERGLRIVDVGTPSLPVEVSVLEMDTPLYDVEVSLGYAYVVTSRSMLVVDVTSPDNPIALAWYDATDAQHLFTDVEASVGYVVLYEWGSYSSYDGLHVVDASNPSIPMRVSFTPLFHFYEAPQMTSAGRFVFYRISGGVSRADLGVPSSPIQSGTAQFDPDLRDMVVAEGYLHLARGWVGLSLHDSNAVCDPPRHPTRRLAVNP